jgi:hypothetical protein
MQAQGQNATLLLQYSVGQTSVSNLLAEWQLQQLHLQLEGSLAVPEPPYSSTAISSSMGITANNM